MRIHKASPLVRLMKWWNPRVVSNYRRGIAAGDLILLLTTKGRHSGRPHLTPLQYEEINGVYHVISTRGRLADWYRNILASPQVEVEVNRACYRAAAEAITDPMRIADFLEYRLGRRPVMLRMMLLLEGLPPRLRRADIEALAAKKALVAIRPLGPLP